ncbi:hypothetical protein GBA52_016956 [Prunus armeniaca]|nr:hypothetical protein GBA52_016956 [Prunus armeniaca]
MDTNIKTCLLLLLLFLDASSGSRVKGFRHVINPANPPSEVIGDMEMRELIAAHAMLDYEKPIPNPRHEKGRPGGGRADSFKDGTELTYSSGHEVNIIEMMKGRKLLLALDAMLDYQEPGANPGHEPRKGGGRGR